MIENVGHCFPGAMLAGRLCPKWMRLAGPSVRHEEIVMDSSYGLICIKLPYASQLI